VLTLCIFLFLLILILLKNVGVLGTNAWLVSTLANAETGMQYPVTSKDILRRIAIDVGGCSSECSQRTVSASN
jgi:hypothetical protein